MVYVAEGGWVDSNQKYVAVIFLPTSSDGPFISQLFARRPSRVKAVNAVWEKYNQYKEDTKGREKPHVGWYVEEANAKIEVELQKIIIKQRRNK